MKFYALLGIIIGLGLAVSKVEAQVLPVVSLTSSVGANVVLAQATTTVSTTTMYSAPTTSPSSMFANPATVATTSGSVAITERVVSWGDVLVRESEVGNVRVSWPNASGTPSWLVFDTKPHASATATNTPRYPFSEVAIWTASTSEARLMGLTPGVTYYMRPATQGTSTPLYGSEISYAVGFPPEPCTYLATPLGAGKTNSTEEVTKLQKFLRYREYMEVDVNGVFDETTRQAVVAYQERYRSYVLTPWQLDRGTGLVYITTLQKINSAYCGKIFALTAVDLAAIASAPKGQSVSGGSTSGGSTVVSPRPVTPRPQTPSPSPSNIFGTTTIDDIEDATTTRRENPITSFFKRLFGRRAPATTTPATSTPRR